MGRGEPRQPWQDRNPIRPPIIIVNFLLSHPMSMSMSLNLNIGLIEDNAKTSSIQGPIKYLFLSKCSFLNFVFHCCLTHVMSWLYFLQNCFCLVQFVLEKLSIFIFHWLQFSRPGCPSIVGGGCRWHFSLPSQTLNPSKTKIVSTKKAILGFKIQFAGLRITFGNFKSPTLPK